jgi:hypothetical protein
MKSARTVTAMIATLLICLSACSSGDFNWQGGLRMEIEWEHYKDVNPVCHRQMANQKIEVSPNYNIDGCKRLDGKRCYIFTDSNTPDGEFGFLVQQCFEERESIIDYLKDG